MLLEAPVAKVMYHGCCIVFLVKPLYIHGDSFHGELHDYIKKDIVYIIKQTILSKWHHHQFKFSLVFKRTSWNNFRKRAKVGGDKLLSERTTPETTREAGKQSTSGGIRDCSVVSFSRDLCSESSAGCLQV